MRTAPISRWILLSLVLATTLTMAACTEATPASSGGPVSTSKPGATATTTIPATPATSPSAPASAQPAAGQGGVPECRDAGILVSSMNGGGAAGHVAVLLTFVNESGHTCYLQGFPSVSLVDAHGNVLLRARSTLNGFIGGASAARRGLMAPPRVVLTPILLAEAVLEWEDVNPIQGVPGGCRVPESAAIVVTPPGSTRTSRLAGLTDVCDAFDIGPVISQIRAPG